MSMETAEPAAEQPEEKLSARTEKELLAVEKTLEEIGQRICSANGSCVTHGYIGLALSEIREAIYHCYRMDAGGPE